MKIFIYGSLMQGEHNHTFLNDEHSKYLRKDITSKEFTLYNLGYFPGMVQDGTGSVLGEIYEISSFVRGRLDQLEGHPQFYRRTLIELQSGEKIETYLLDKAYVRGCPIIKSGDWRDL